MRRSRKEIDKEKKSVRDTWIPETWRYNGSGYQNNKKKELYRKRKHKRNSSDEIMA